MRHMRQGVRAIPTDEAFTHLCQQTGGNVTAIAQRLGVHRSTINRWIADRASFAESVENARETSLDVAEDRMMLLIRGIPVYSNTGERIGWKERPDAGLIKFKLATHGRKRGYTDSP